MALSPGTTIGPYEITAPLGAGGMGEVYRATDTKLKREVAIKALPDEVAGDADRLSRFEREAHVLASLNHPHIASIYGLEESDGVPCLVLELVEGQTLAERLGAGVLPVEQALELARQTASALEAAHEKGVIHRDLKPANIKITPEGSIKVLDFGLAKAFAEEPAGGPIDATKSPTLTMSATRAGVILGTAAYMSPEQARGKPVDPGTDVWAFGCVLYEMLTGRQAFPGETASDCIAGILGREPEWEALPAHTPLKVRELLRRCLRKEHRDRVHAVADARIEIEEVLKDPEAADVVARAKLARRPAWVRALPLVLAAAMTLAFLVLLRTHVGTSPGGTAGARHLSVVLPPQLELYGERPTIVAVSPDGRRLAAVVDDDGTQRLFLRNLDEVDGGILAGTDGANSPFFSPDGEWVGFRDDDDDSLWKVHVNGGAPVVIVEKVWGRGAIWGPDDFVIFNKSFVGGLWRVPAAGGTPEELTGTGVPDGEQAHWWPQLFAGGSRLLFTHIGADTPGSRVVVRAMDTGREEILVEDAAFGRYVPTGHLIYMQRGIFFAVRFDSNTLETRGSPVPILDGVAKLETIYKAGHLDISAEGTLVYVAQRDLYPGADLVWVDRSGTEQKLDIGAGSYANPRLSPDGRRLALMIEENLWVYELSDGRADRLTFSSVPKAQPTWSPDGRQVFYGRGLITFDLYRISADGGGEEELLHSTGSDLYPRSVSRDGKALVYSEWLADSGFDLWVLPLEGKVEPELFLRTPFNESDADLSPNGGWLAYTSNESESNEVYVQEFPGGGRKNRVSIDGGENPFWSDDGTELYFINHREHTMMAASVTDGGAGPVFGKPRALFQGRYDRHWTEPNYDLAADGRFLMVKTPLERAPRQINVVLNWFEELERLVPAE